MFRRETAFCTITSDENVDLVLAQETSVESQQQQGTMTKLRFSPGSLVYVAGLLLVAAGCGSRGSLPLAPVHGTVSCRGKPLDRGTVVFLPEPGTPGPPAVGYIQPDGSYQLSTLGRNGASIGWHRVLVHLRRQPTKAEERQMGVVLESLIPEKTPARRPGRPLRFEVKAGTNEHT